MKNGPSWGRFSSVPCENLVQNQKTSENWFAWREMNAQGLTGLDETFSDVNPNPQGSNMSNEYPEVHAEDFTKLTIEKQPHQEIENALIGMGGAKFKNETLKRAGWSGDRLTSFAKRPEDAANAFNKIRAALAKTDDPELLWQMFD